MLFNKNYQVVNESYVGATGKLRAAEEELKKVIILINTFGVPNMDLTKSINSSSAAKNFNKLLSEEFGTNIIVNFTPMTVVPGGLAYTPVNSTPLSAISTLSEYTKTGKIKSHERLLPIFVNIDYNIVNKAKLESDELMGIILHEIGHNIRHIPIINSLFIIDSFLISPLVGTGLGLADLLTSGIGSLPVINQFLKFKNIITNTISDLTGDRLFPIIGVFELLVFKTHKIVTLFNPVRYLTGYHAERYSDSLATAYGYGPGLSRGLLKIHPTTTQSTFNKAVRSNVITSFGDAMLLTFMDIVSLISMRSVHPAVGHRIKNSLNKLERDLKSGKYPPEVKKQLEKDLAELRKLYDDYLESSDFNKDKSLSLYRKAVERYGADPIRNLLLDKVYQQLEV